MRKKTLLLLLCLSIAASCMAGISVTAFADGSQGSGGCAITTARDDSEVEYRIHLAGTGITDGSFDNTKVKINDKTLAQYGQEGKIAQIYSNGEAGVNLVRIDLPDFGEGILKFDGTDTVTLLSGFKVGTGGTAIEQDYVHTLSDMHKPSINFGFPSGIDVTDNAIEVTSGTLEFTPVFTAGAGREVKETSVKLNGNALTADGDGKYTATFSFGTNTLVFRTENEAAPCVFNEITVTVNYPDPVVEGPIYVSTASFKRNASGRPEYKDKLSLRFSNVIESADQADLTVSINGKEVDTSNVDWSSDGRQADIATLFFNENTNALGGFYKYDGTDEITVSGVTAEANTIKMTSDGQLYNVTKDETEPAYKGEGYVSVKEVTVQRGHEEKHKDAIHIYFNENADIRGSADISEGVLLFNTGTVKINGQNLQAFWDANNSTKAFWVTSSPSYLRIDVFYDSVSDNLWNRSGDNTITVSSSFITMTDLGLGKGAGEYTYDAEDGTVYAPGQQRPEAVDLSLVKMRLLKEYEPGNDWVQLVFDKKVWNSSQINVQNNTRITDNIVFNGKTLTELKSGLAKCEIHAGADNADTLRMTISSANDHADLKKLLKTDGTDVVTVKAGMGLNKYVCVKSDCSVPGLNDVAPPEVTLTAPTEAVNQAEYEIKFTVTDDSDIYSTTVKLGDKKVEKNGDGKYIVTLASGANTVSVTVIDNTVFRNTTTKSITLTYEAKPVITVSGATDGETVNAAAKKITVSVDAGSITGVKLGDTDLQAGSDGKYAFTLAEGENKITVTAQNGSTVSEKTITVTLDTVPPAITLSAKEETVTKAEYAFTVTAPDAQTVAVKLNGSTVAAGESGYAVTLVEGENTITVTATDKAGNIGTAQVKVIFAPEKNAESKGEEGGTGCGSAAACALPVVALMCLTCSLLVLRKKKA
ncbi:hypothetical protein [Pumilibacter intestinalis]|uniref:hypothetical protein n=1 Tax=Pumilibacter intestinalis TaxID=2941511 RepID=UPI00203A6D99|nr:hypothetical protein [Pumilibacter intestinalis]